MRRAPRLAVCALGGLLALSTAAGAAETTFLLVRHAEKEGEGENPDLNDAGRARAEALAGLAERFRVNAIYATETCRTAQTALPVARRLRMPIAVQPGGAGIEHCDPFIDVPVIFLEPELGETAPFVDHLLAEQRGRVVLIVGHSNTLPALLAALGGEAFPQVVVQDGEYDRLFVATVPDEGTPSLFEQPY